MKLYKKEKREALRQVERVLMGLVHGHDPTLHLTVREGLMGLDTPYRLSLTKQMTIDYYTGEHREGDEVPHFLVLDVMVNTRYLYPSYAMISSRWNGPNRNVRLTTPEDLALRIYHSYKRKRSGE